MKRVLGLIAVAADTSTASAGGAHSSCPGARVGAIRWDDWYGPTDATGLATVRCLSPAHWHYRLPFFATVINSSAVTWNGATQEVTDQEIAYAREAGLDYWAFVAYDEGAPLSRSLANYVASPHRGDLGFSLILEAGRLGEWYGDNATWANESQRLGALFTDPLFERVAIPATSSSAARSPGGNGSRGGGARGSSSLSSSPPSSPPLRPLVYIMGVQSENVGVMAEALPALAAVARNRVGAAPYYVLVNSDNSQARHLAGLTAVGAYAHGAGSPHGAPFAALMAASNAYWDASASQGFDVIPHAQLGWDPRPRNENPPPWLPHGEGADWVENATAADVAAGVEAALQWSCDHRGNSSVTGHTLIYAWNENTEGGWLTPTLRANGTVDTSRLDALKPILTRAP